MKTLLKQYSFLLDRAAKRQLPILFLFFLSTSFLDMFGIGLISVFLLLIVNFDSVIHKFPFALQTKLSHFPHNKIIVGIGIAMIMVFVFKGFWGVYSQKKLIYFTSQFAVRLKIRLMTAYQSAAYLFHLQQNSAYLINKISLADSFAGGALSTILNFILSFFVTVGVLAYLFIIHPLTTSFLAIMVGVIFIVYEFFVKNVITTIGKVMSESGGEINKAILQALGGLKEVRVLGREFFFLGKVKSVAQNYSLALSIYNSLQLIPRYAVESAASVFLVSLVLGALFIGTNPLNMIPTLGVFAAACIRLLPTISQLIGQFSQLRTSRYATNLLYNELNALENKYKTSLTSDINEHNRQDFFQFSLHNVSFQYANTKRNALDGIDLKLVRGQSIGLMGSSGAGKSTLVSIILGLISPDSGQFLVDGLPMQNLRSWLNNFAYIPQSIFLLDDTLKRNVAMGTEDNEIDDTKLNHAIDMAQLSSVVADLPDGVNTLIGENGVRLSGGQRQRVALARALYYEREIIVMDEATSSLDNETEREVINAIKELHGVKTLIVIAHRLSTIRYCDIVYKLEKGRVVAQGSFDQVVGTQEPIFSNENTGDNHA